MRTLTSILLGLAAAAMLEAVDAITLHGGVLVVLSRPIALLLAALTGTRLEQEWSIVLVLAAMPITLFAIGIALGGAIDWLRASDRPA